MFSKNNFYIKLNKYRKAMQVFSLLFLIAVPILILLDIRYIIGNLYSISIWEIDIVDPSMVIQTIILSKEFYIPLIIAAIIPIALALIFGRVFCSWMCPYNTLLELLELRSIKRIQRKLFKRKKSKNKNPRTYIYWTIFSVIIISTLLIGLPIFTWFSMPGIISSEIFAAIIGLGIGIDLLIFGIIFLSEVVLGNRYWCKYVCPVGASLSLFRTKYTMKITYNESVCDCAAYAEPCAGNCPLNLRPKEKMLYPYCFNCGRCIKVCEQTGNQALTFAFTDKDDKKENINNVEV
ncbi:MAG: 4Fe-4S binding protein [Ignavibacteriae bacterium]|nr:4Fe-4S binding protein [Ignavibacteriota bacterium]NOG96440.1 4Fe-4S binding protein [Ignavibacteriota bacterium]